MLTDFGMASKRSLTELDFILLAQRQRYLPPSCPLKIEHQIRPSMVYVTLQNVYQVHWYMLWLCWQFVITGNKINIRMHTATIICIPKISFLTPSCLLPILWPIWAKSAFSYNNRPSWAYCVNVCIIACAAYPIVAATTTSSQLQCRTH